MVDGTLLLDPGPDAGSRGEDLSAVRTVLISHDHPDHLDPAFLLAWSWAGGPELTVAGPPQAIERCRPWVAGEAPVRWHPLVAGDTLVAGAGGSDPLHVRALPAAHSTSGGHDHDGTALLYEVSGADAALLYATDTRALPHDQLAGPYDLVLLELTFGDHTAHGTAHLDLPAFGHELAQLRAAGRLASGGRAVAVHLSHHNPVDLADRLRVIGAEALPDGSIVVIGSGSAGPAGHERRGRGRAGEGTSGRSLLITGGARSGKSARAEALAASRAGVTYVATAPQDPDDAEWVARIARHRARRPSTWQVAETADIAGVLRGAPAQHTVLIDCLTLWLTGLLAHADAWDEPEAAQAIVDRATAELVEALASARCEVILVTNEVGSGVVPASASGRLFRDLLGRVNTTVAAACDDVEVVTVGLPSTAKGQPWTTRT